MIKLTYQKSGQEPIVAVYDDSADWPAICNKVRERMFPEVQLGFDPVFERIMQARKTKTKKTKRRKA